MKRFLFAALLVLPAAAQTDVQEAPVCGEVLRQANPRAWVMATPGQMLTEGSILRVERAGKLLHTARVVQAGNGVGLVSPLGGFPLLPGDVLRLEYAAPAAPISVARSNLPSGQDPVYQDWLRRPAGLNFSTGSFAGSAGYDYGYDPGYGYYGGYNNYGWNLQPVCPPCPQESCPPPRPPEPEYRAFGLPGR